MVLVKGLSTESFQKITDLVYIGGAGESLCPVLFTCRGQKKKLK